MSDVLSDALRILNRQIVSCELCPRLRTYGREVARVKRRAYLDWEYWGKPVPGFGDPEARVLLIGLAPGAHGANRTGRMFTGDSSGDFLYHALYETGFASQAESRSREDGLELRDAYITAAARCAPSDNKPLPEELARCRPYLERELDLLKEVRVVVALGGVAFRTYLGILRDRGAILSLAAFPFGHHRVYHFRRRAADADRVLSPQPAKHVHGQTHGHDVARSLRTRAKFTLAPSRHAGHGAT